MFIHALNFVCFVVHFALLSFFLIQWFSYIIVNIPTTGFLGMGTFGFKPLESREVFLDFSAATWFCCFC